MSWSRCLAIAATVAASPLGACYRPHVIDCAARCERSGTCAEGMICSAGLCTRGSTCVHAVAAGARHSCAICGDGVACWGHDGYGQLGASGAAASTEELRPVPAVMAGEPATALAAGGRHTCAVLDRGASVACWGDDAYGQLGVSAGQPLPRQNIVTFGSGHLVTSISAGLGHTCVVDNDDGGATKSGVVRCWGDSRLGQLGPADPSDGEAAARSGFAAVNLGGTRAVAVAAGAYHTCALLEDGAVACWGWNDYLQLGRPSPDPIAGVITVDVGRRALAVAAGGYHTCAILDGGQVACWGQDDAGQIGVKPPAGRTGDAPTAVDLGSGRTARSIALGTSHGCAVLDDASVKCWGLDVDGELGRGSSSAPGSDGAFGDALPRVALGEGPVGAISAGAHHTCAIQGAVVKCWGSNDSGDLGVGDTRNRGDDPTRPIVAVDFGM